jgi:hypothetical protein
MDRNILLKQFFFTSYDMIRFDILTIDNSVKELEKIKNSYTVKDIEKILDNTRENIYQKKIITAISTIIDFVIIDELYNIDIVINNMLSIIFYERKRKYKYDQYLNYICNI